MPDTLNEQHYTAIALSADIGKALVEERKLSDILKKCTEAIVQHLGAMGARIWLLDKEKKSLLLQASSGSGVNFCKTLGQLPLDQSQIGRSVLDKKPYISNAVATNMGPTAQNWLKQEQIVALAVHPLLAGDTVLGAVALFSNTPLSDTVLTYLSSISDQIALGVLREEANAALRKSEATLKSIFNVAPTGIGLVSNRILIDVNDRLCEMTGFTRKEMVGQSARILYPTKTEFQRVGYEKYSQINQYGSGMLEARWRKKDGRIIDILQSATPLNPSDWSAGIAFTALDITDRKNAEKALRESEERFRTFFKLAPIPICLNDSNGKFLMVNDALSDMLGYSKNELLSMTSRDITYPDDIDLTVKNVLALNKSSIKVVSFEQRYIKKNKQIVWGAVSIARLVSLGSTKYQYITHILDVTQRKNLEDQLFQAQKMKAIGTLAGGIAHDFNNLLMAIQGRISLLMMSTQSADPQREHLKAIETHIQSAATLTRQLLGFARGGPRIVTSTNLNEVVKEQNYMFGQTRKEISIHGNYEPNLWRVEVDRNQIKQALLDIYINAWQAMPKGGSLFIQTENVTIPEENDFSVEKVYQKYVKISITDTGTGMNELTRQRVFEPFFTTQQLGKGTGLGLSTTYGIIKNHNGFITVDSALDKGSTFHIYLPAASSGMTSRRKGNQLSMGKSETILLVDDEMIVLEVGKQLLETIGYNVIIAENGKKAINTYTGHYKEIDLVILDMIMPDVSGEEVLVAFQAVNPKVRVILSSGYNQEGVTSETLKRGCQGFLQKPFHLSQFSEKIREVLDAQNEG